MLFLVQLKHFTYLSSQPQVHQALLALARMAKMEDAVRQEVLVSQEHPVLGDLQGHLGFVIHQPV